MMTMEKEPRTEGAIQVKDVFGMIQITNLLTGKNFVMYPHEAFHLRNLLNLVFSETFQETSNPPEDQL
jgi:hypothetical protein